MRMSIVLEKKKDIAALTLLVIAVIIAIESVVRDALESLKVVN